jgi:hypothetical protein
LSWEEGTFEFTLNDQLGHEVLLKSLTEAVYGSGLLSEVNLRSSQDFGLSLHTERVRKADGGLGRLETDLTAEMATTSFVPITEMAPDGRRIVTSSFVK